MSALHQLALQTSINWWDLVPATLGALVGALAAGVPAYMIAQKQSDESLKRDQLDRERHAKLSANRVFSKLMQINNDLLDLRQQIEVLLSQPIADGDMFPNQRRISIMVGYDNTPINFDTDDLVIFINATDIELAGEIDLLRRRRNALVLQLAEYRERKILHASLLSEAKEVIFAPDGRTILQYPADRYPKVQYEEAQLESLITPLIDMVREESRDCVIISEKFNMALERMFDAGVQRFNLSAAKAALLSFGDDLEELTKQAELI